MATNFISTLIQLSESDKRFLLALFLVIILVFVIIAYLGKLIVRVTKHQGKKLDKLVAPVLKMKVITDPKDFKKYANKKNWIILYKQARIPVLIMIVSAFILLITNLVTHDFSRNPFVNFSSLLFHFKWDIGVNEEGVLQIPKIACTHTPEFKAEYIPDYLFVLGMLTGLIWYLFRVQSFLGRMWRIRSLTESVFKNSLDNYNQLDDIAQNGIPQALAQQEQQKQNSDINN